jgi:hypothetical protein
VFSNPYVRAFLGGLATAIAVATPLVDDGVTVSEILSIASAFLAGTGAVAVQPSGTPKPKPSGWEGGA